MKTQRILLAGAGDLGRRAASLLIAQGHEVWGLRRNPPADDPLAVRWLGADLTRPDTLRQLPDAISHVVYAPTPDERNERAYRSLFVDGLRNLVSALDTQALQRLIFISSTAVYAPAAQGWVNEDTRPDPQGFNGRILLEAEDGLRPLGSKAIVFTLAGLYGPGRTQLLSQLREGRLRVSRHVRNWTNRFHIEDAAAATVHLLTLANPYPRYIGCDGVPRAQSDLYDDLAALLRAAPPQDLDNGLDLTESGKRLSNARLLASGYKLIWPDAIAGYRAILKRDSSRL